MKQGKKLTNNQRALAALLCVIIMIVSCVMSGKETKQGNPSPVSGRNARESVSGQPGGQAFHEEEPLPFETYYQPFAQKDIVFTESGVPYVGSQLLLTAEDGVTKSQIEALLSPLGGSVIGYIEMTGDYQITLADSMPYDQLQAIAEELEQDPLVFMADLHYVYSLEEAAVYDNEYPAQTTLTSYAWKDPWTNTADDGTGDDGPDHSFGSPAFPAGYQWWAEAVHLPFFWEQTDDIGLSPIRVGVIDNYFTTSHEDMPAARVYQDHPDPSVAIGSGIQQSFHGNHVTGLIAAPENGKGIRGASRNAELTLYSYTDYMIPENDLEAVSPELLKADTYGTTESAYDLLLLEAIQTRSDPLDNPAFLDILEKFYLKRSVLSDDQISRILHVLRNAPRTYLYLYLLTLPEYTIVYTEKGEDRCRFDLNANELKIMPFDVNDLLLGTFESSFFHESGHAILHVFNKLHDGAYTAPYALFCDAMMYMDVMQKLYSSLDELPDIPPLTDEQKSTVVNAFLYEETGLPSMLSVFREVIRDPASELSENAQLKMVYEQLKATLSMELQSKGPLNSSLMTKDIYGALTHNKLYTYLGQHSTDYWYGDSETVNFNLLITEAWAEYFSAKILKDTAVQEINAEYFPTAAGNGLTGDKAMQDQLVNELDLPSEYIYSFDEGALGNLAQVFYNTLVEDYSDRFYQKSVYDSEYNSSDMSFKYAVAVMLQRGIRLINLSNGYTSETASAWYDEQQGLDLHTSFALRALDRRSASFERFIMKCGESYPDFLIIKAACNESNTSTKYSKNFDSGTKSEEIYNPATGYSLRIAKAFDTNYVATGNVSSRYDYLGHIPESSPARQHIIIVGSLDLNYEIVPPDEKNKVWPIRMNYSRSGFSCTDADLYAPGGSLTASVSLGEIQENGQFAILSLNSFAFSDAETRALRQKFLEGLETSEGNTGKDIDTWNAELAALAERFYRESDSGRRNGTVSASGTSMATPIVTGIAADIWGKYPGMTSAQLRNCLLSQRYVTDGPETSAAESGSGTSVPMADVIAAMKEADDLFLADGHQQSGYLSGITYMEDPDDGSLKIVYDSDIYLYDQEWNKIYAFNQGEQDTFSLLIPPGEYYVRVINEEANKEYIGGCKIKDCGRTSLPVHLKNRPAAMYDFAVYQTVKTGSWYEAGSGAVSAELVGLGATLGFEYAAHITDYDPEDPMKMKAEGKGSMDEYGVGISYRISHQNGKTNYTGEMYGMPVDLGDMGFSPALFDFSQLQESHFTDLREIDEYSFRVHLDMEQLRTVAFDMLNVINTSDGSGMVGGTLEVRLRKDMSLDSISLFVSTGVGYDQNGELSVYELGQGNGLNAAAAAYDLTYRFSDQEIETEGSRGSANPSGYGNDMNYTDIFNFGGYGNSMDDLTELILNGF